MSSYRAVGWGGGLSLLELGSSRSRVGVIVFVFACGPGKRRGRVTRRYGAGGFLGTDIGSPARLQDRRTHQQ